MDCKTLVRALYPDRFPDRPVRWEAAYRWLADVGVEVVYIASRRAHRCPQGRTYGMLVQGLPGGPGVQDGVLPANRAQRLDTECRWRGRCRVPREEAEELMGPRPPVPAFSWTPQRRLGARGCVAALPTPPRPRQASATRCGPGPGRATGREAEGRGAIGGPRVHGDEGAAQRALGGATLMLRLAAFGFGDGGADALQQGVVVSERRKTVYNGVAHRIALAVLRRLQQMAGAATKMFARRLGLVIAIFRRIDDSRCSRHRPRRCRSASCRKAFRQGSASSAM